LEHEASLNQERGVKDTRYNAKRRRFKDGEILQRRKPENSIDLLQEKDAREIAEEGKNSNPIKRGKK
jgi:hypothetical protein